MQLVGLTGGIATGKSTAARFLRELGQPVIDADQVARQVVEPGEDALGALVQAFGDGILLDDGTLDRTALRRRIASDPEARATVNSITHPAIRMRIATQLQQLATRGAPAAFVEAALLVETGSHAMYPHLWVVTCSPQVQLERLMARDGMTEDGARQLIATQLPLDEKASYATRVLTNDGNPDALRSQVEAALNDLLST